MKRVLTILLMFMALLLFTACQTSTTTEVVQTTETATTEATTVESTTEAPITQAPTTEEPATTTEWEVPTRTGITGLSFTSDVTDYEGTWKVVKVYADGVVHDAVTDAITLDIMLDLDPYELVDGDLYIHNQVYNLSSSLTFGLTEINTALSEEEVDQYRGTTYWESFVMGQVAEESEPYVQPGPAIMTFRDIDILGLFLDLVAGIDAEIDTTNKNLIIGFNNDGQLLLGYSDVHLERPLVEGDWEYCLIFELE